MHAEMLLILMVTMIVAQIMLIEWKRRHFKSFQVNVIFLFQHNFDKLLIKFLDCDVFRFMGHTIYNVH